MTAWVRKRLGKDKIVVMGYSYGTTVGLALARRRPEWLHAYVGAGQAKARTDAGETMNFPDGSHLDENGEALVAERVAAFLEARGLLRSR